MTVLPTKYLTRKQLIEKYSFLTENMLKNLLFKNLGGIREKCVCKLGRRILFDEEAFLKFVKELSEGNLDR